MTPDELTEWRLQRADRDLEEFKATALETQRQVDRLKIEISAATTAVGVQGEKSEQHQTQVMKALERVHERLDELKGQELIEQGAEEERDKQRGLRDKAVLRTATVVGALVAVATFVGSKI